MGASHTLKISSEVKTIINSCVADGLVLKLPERQLDRKLYLDVKKVVEAAGGAWKTNKAGFLFPSAADLEKCVGAGKGEEIVRTKVVQQAFYTPADAAEIVIDLAGVGLTKAKPTILEPSCGAGALVHAALNRSPLAKVVGYDNDPAAVEASQVRFSKNPNVAIRLQDFLTVKPSKYDFILMNSPWQNGQAVLHFNWATKFMAKGSRLVCVVPANFDPVGLDTEYEVATQHLRKGAFKESGTMVSARVVRLVKK